MPIIGAQPKDGVEGAEEHAPPADPPSDTEPNQMIGQAVGERAAQLTEQGYDVEVRYFTTLQALLCWLLQNHQNHLAAYRSVEIYCHGTQDGPGGGFGQTKPEETERWKALAELLKRIMTSGPGQNGWIVFGWCKSAKMPQSGSEGLEGGASPGGVVAGGSGHPVYGCGNDMDLPFETNGEDPPEPDDQETGEPFGQPSPLTDDASSPGTHPPLPPEDSGWRRFPPQIGTPAKPNDGLETPEIVTPEQRGDVGGVGLPKSELEGGLDPHAGTSPPPPQPPPSNEPVGTPPTFTVPEDLGC